MSWTNEIWSPSISPALKELAATALPLTGMSHLHIGHQWIEEQGQDSVWVICTRHPLPGQDINGLVLKGEEIIGYRYFSTSSYSDDPNNIDIDLLLVKQGCSLKPDVNHTFYTSVIESDNKPLGISMTLKGINAIYSQPPDDSLEPLTFGHGQSKSRQTSQQAQAPKSSTSTNEAPRATASGPNASSGNDPAGAAGGDGEEPPERPTESFSQPAFEPDAEFLNNLLNFLNKNGIHVLARKLVENRTSMGKECLAWCDSCNLIQYFGNQDAFHRGSNWAVILSYLITQDCTEDAQRRFLSALHHDGIYEAFKRAFHSISQAPLKKKRAPAETAQPPKKPGGGSQPSADF